MTKREVMILDVPYSLKFGKRSEFPLMSKEHQGETRFFTKEIFVCTDFEDDFTKEDKKVALENIIRHELAHAFLYESGFEDYASDEQLVTWMEIVLPRLMQKVIDVVMDCKYNELFDKI